VVWLGEEVDDTAIGIELIKNASPQWEKYHGPINLVMDSSTVKAMEAGPMRVSFDSDRSKELGFPAAEDPKWNAVLKTLSSLWFERMWIVQEVVESKLPIVMIGTRQF
jgi:hypothetical protein